MGPALPNLRGNWRSEPARVGCEYELGLNGVAPLLIGAEPWLLKKKETLTVPFCEEDERGAGKKLSGRLDNDWSQLQLDRNYVMEPC
jgi:hypothetical protein